MATAKIVISNETNIKIDGLDLDTRKKLVKKFKYEIPGARYTPAVKLGRWDGMKAFCSLAAQTYVNLLPEIIPILEEEGYQLELEDLRDYNSQFSFAQVTEDSYGHITWPKGHRYEGQPIIMHEDQVEAINTFLTDTQSIQCLSTGFGKSILTAVLSHKCESYGRTIVVVPSKDLVKQTEADYINMGLDVGVLYGDRKEYQKTHTICTWQSLNSLFKDTKNYQAEIPIDEFIDGVVCIMVDEGHVIKGASLLEMLTGPFAKIPIRWAITGTIPKEEYAYRSLQVAIGNVIGTVKASTLQEKGFLANCHVNVIQLVDYVEYKNYQDELKYLLETNDRMAAIAKVIQAVSATGNTLVLIDRVEPGKNLASMIPESVFISGNTKSKDRKEQYDIIETDKNQVLVATYGIASVGINLVNIFNLVLIEPGKSFVRVIQSIGRGLRKGSEKDFVNIYDITSTCKFAKRHLTQRKQFYKDSEYKFSIEKLDWQAIPKGK